MPLFFHTSFSPQWNLRIVFNKFVMSLHYHIKKSWQLYNAGTKGVMRSCKSWKDRQYNVNGYRVKQ